MQTPPPDVSSDISPSQNVSPDWIGNSHTVRKFSSHAAVVCLIGAEMHLCRAACLCVGLWLPRQDAYVYGIFFASIPRVVFQHFSMVICKTKFTGYGDLLKKEKQSICKPIKLQSLGPTGLENADLVTYTPGLMTVCKLRLFEKYEDFRL